MVMWDVRGPLVEFMIKVCSLRRGKKNTNGFKGWKERPVFGKVQYIRCKWKFNVKLTNEDREEVLVNPTEEI